MVEFLLFYKREN